MSRKRVILKKWISTLIVIMMLFNYISMLTNVVHAIEIIENGTNGEIHEFSLVDNGTVGGAKQLVLTIRLANVKMFGMGTQFTFDTSKLSLANPTSNAVLAAPPLLPSAIVPQTTVLDPVNNITLTGAAGSAWMEASRTATSAGVVNLTMTFDVLNMGMWKDYPELTGFSDYVGNINITPAGLDLFKIYFRLKDGVDISEIDENVITVDAFTNEWYETDGDYHKYLANTLTKSGLLAPSTPSVSVTSASIKAGTLSTTGYEHGDTFDVSAGTLQVTYSDSTTAELPISTITADVGFKDGKNTADVNDQFIKLTYGGVDVTPYAVAVTDPVTSIAVTSQPSTLTYNNQDPLVFTNGKITATTKSGVQTVHNFSDAGVTLSDAYADLSSGVVTGHGTNGLPCGNQTITVTYQGKTANYIILINDTIDHIVMNAAPKTTYNYEQNLDLSTGSIMAHTTSGAQVPIALNNGSVTVTGYNKTPTYTGTSRQDTQNLTVTFLGETTTYNVAVNDYVDSITVVSPKTVYNYGQALDKTVGTVKEILKTGRDGNTAALSAAGVNVTGYNPNQLGAQTLTVTYSGKTKTYSVTVNDYVTGITVTPPTKTTYQYNEPLDLTDGIISVVMASGTLAGVTLDSSMLSPAYNQTPVFSAGQTTVNQNLTVTHGGYTGTISLTTIDTLTGITLKTAPTKVGYKYNETLDVTGGVITAARASGAIQDINLTSTMVTGYNETPTFSGTQKVTQPLGITYTENGTTKTIASAYSVDIINETTNIAMGTTPKQNYLIGELQDLTGGTITVTRQSGSPETVSLTDLRVSVTGFNSSTAGTNKPQTVTFTENGVVKTTTYNINVSVPLSTNANLSDLTVGGATVNGFDKDVTTYNVTLPAGTTTAPTVAGVKEDAKSTVNVTQANIGSRSNECKGNCNSRIWSN